MLSSALSVSISRRRASVLDVGRLIRGNSLPHMGHSGSEWTLEGKSGVRQTWRFTSRSLVAPAVERHVAHLETRTAGFGEEIRVPAAGRGVARHQRERARRSMSPVSMSRIATSFSRVAGACLRATNQNSSLGLPRELEELQRVA